MCGCVIDQEYKQHSVSYLHGLDSLLWFKISALVTMKV